MGTKNRSAAKTPPSKPHGVPLDGNDVGFSPSGIEKAALRFPAFFSIENVFHRRIVETERSAKWPGASLWLPESAMLNTKLTSGSLVSVSLASQMRNIVDDFPLDLLSKPYLGDSTLDHLPDTIEAGNYFAIASAFPSSKVPKDGVKLSWNLSCTLGNTLKGRTIFICPVEFKSVDEVMQSDDPSNIGVSQPLLSKCDHANFRLVPMEECVAEESTIVSPSILSSQFADENTLSPKTPLGCQSRLNKSATPTNGSRSSKCKDSRSIPDLHNATSIMKTNLSSIRSALEDEKLKDVLQGVAVRWLLGRILLPGNLVAIPMLGQRCFFRMESDILRAPDPVVHKDMNTTNISCCESVNKKMIKEPFVAFAIEDKTRIHLSSSTDGSDLKDGEIHLPVPGGLSKEFAEIQEIINSLIKKDTLLRMGLPPKKGILLHGPPGTGKTSLARACTHHAGVKLFVINGPEIVSQNYGESEQALAAVFDSAKQAAPSVVFIDELDAIAPSREDSSEELSGRILATLINSMDEVTRDDSVLTIAATNRPDSIDPALRRSGRFDQEIEIGAPSRSQREEILLALLSEMKHSLVDSDISDLASVTHGFVGADLAALCHEAAHFALRRYIEVKQLSSKPVSSKQHLESYAFEAQKVGLVVLEREDSPAPDRAELISSSLSNLSLSTGLSNDEGVDDVNVSPSKDACLGGLNAMGIISSDSIAKSALSTTLDDFEKAKKKVRPSAMREIMLEVPRVSWTDVGGQKDIKQKIVEMVMWPQKHQEDFRRIGTHPPSGILMYGPPGCSKTLMARAVASEARLNFLAVKGPELFSKWVGESEKAIKSLFSKAKAASPSIIFFDEIDGLAATRGHDGSGSSVSTRVMNQLLVELNNLNQQSGVAVIAATNRPDKIDPALLRPGRFDGLLFVGPPNKEDRREIFQIHLRKRPCSPDVSIEKLAALTEGYTGADISLICNEAAKASIEENNDAMEISMRHFIEALSQVKPSDTTAYMEFYGRFRSHESTVSF